MVGVVSLLVRFVLFITVHIVIRKGTQDMHCGMQQEAAGGSS